MRFNRRTGGYSLVELIIVIAIIGILAPGMALIFTNIIDSYRTMNATNTVTKRGEFLLSRFTQDVNDCAVIRRADDKELEVEISTAPVQTYRYKIDDSDGTVKLCQSNCGTASNFKTIIKGVQSTSAFRYYDISVSELANSPGKPWLYNNSAHKPRLNAIIYVELKLDLAFMDGTASFSSFVHPDHKVTL